MAIAKTGTEFYTELNELTNNKFNNISDPVKLRFINRAILNRFIEIKSLNPSFYRKFGTLTATGGSSDLALPTDIDRGTDFLLFYDETRVRIVPQSEYRVVGGDLHFNFNISEGTNYYIEYTKEPNRYTVMTDSIVETGDVRLLEVLQSEVETIRDEFVRQGQFSPQAQAAQMRTNQIT